MLHYSKKKKKKSLVIKKQKSGNLSFKKKLGLSVLTAAASSAAIIKLKNLYNKKINLKENEIYTSENNPFALDTAFNLTVIPPKDIFKYLLKNNKIDDLWIDNLKEVKKQLEEQNINFYIVPLTLSNDNIYWTDYPTEYLYKYYGNDWIKKSFVKLIIYFLNDLNVDMDKTPKIDYQLDLKEKQLVMDTFIKYFPYNYYWNGNDNLMMDLFFHKRSKKCKRVIIKEWSNYPCVQISVNLDLKDNKSLLSYKNGFLNSKEFSHVIYEKLKKKCKSIDDFYGEDDFFIEMNGITDLEYVKKFVNSLKSIKVLTFGKHLIKIEKIEAILFNEEKNYDDQDAFIQLI